MPPFSSGRGIRTPDLRVMSPTSWPTALSHNIFKEHFELVASPGFEPGTREPKSPVLPLHHEAKLLGMDLHHLLTVISMASNINAS